MQNKLTREDIKNKVFTIVKDKIVYDNIWWDKHSKDGENLLWYEEIGADSLDTIEVIMELESELGVIFPDDVFEYQKTLGGIIDQIYNVISNANK